ISRSACPRNSSANLSRTRLMLSFAKFEQGLTYNDFLARYANEGQKERWRQVHAQVALTPAQRQLLAGFRRQMNVLCLAGAWCGDCINQCPIYEHFAIGSRRIQVRYFDRDANPDLGQALSVCGGARVPVVVFLSEDNFQVGWYGDRTLSKYRKMVADEFAPACPTGLIPEQDSLLAAVTQDWLNEFERVQLI